MRAVDIFSIAAAVVIALASLIMQPWSASWWAGMAAASAVTLGALIHILWGYLPAGIKTVLAPWIGTAGLVFGGLCIVAFIWIGHYRVVAVQKARTLEAERVVPPESTKQEPPKTEPSPPMPQPGQPTPTQIRPPSNLSSTMRRTIFECEKPGNMKPQAKKEILEQRRKYVSVLKRLYNVDAKYEDTPDGFKLITEMDIPGYGRATKTFDVVNYKDKVFIVVLLQFSSVFDALLSMATLNLHPDDDYSKKLQFEVEKTFEVPAGSCKMI